MTERKDIFSILPLWFGVAALVLSPTQWALRLPGDIHLSPADPLIWLAFILLVISASWQRNRALLRPPPLLLIVFILLTFLSLLAAENKLAAIKEFIQYTEYFAAGFVVFRGMTANGFSMRRFAMLFSAAATVVIFCGLFQYFTPSVPNFEVRGTFGNHNVYGGFLALTLPLLYGACLEKDFRRPVRTWLAITIAAGTITVLSGGAWVAILTAFGVVSVLKSQRAFLVFAATAVLLMAWVLPALPRTNPEVWLDSTAFYESDGAAAQRYPEWQAATGMAIEHPLLGVGAGNYQRRIGMFYGIIPNRPESSVPDSQNLYLVLASSLGFPAMLAFAGALIFFLRAAAEGALKNTKQEKGIAAGLVGSMVGFGVSSIWSPLLVRGIGLPLTALMVLAILSGPHKSDDRNKQYENT